MAEMLEDLWKSGGVAGKIFAVFLTACAFAPLGLLALWGVEMYIRAAQSAL